MAGMERFTQRARRVLSFAHQEAERAQNNTIGSEHLLLGLLHQEGDISSHVLHEIGITIDRVHEATEVVSKLPPNFDPNRVELGSETQQALEFAVEEARRFGHHYIGTEHILLGLVRQEGVAMDVLRRLGVRAEQIRRQTRRVLNESAAAPKNISTGTVPVSQRLHQVVILHAQEDQKKTIESFIQTMGLNPVLIDNHPKIEQGLELLDGFSKDVDLAILVLAIDPGVEKPESKILESIDQDVVYELGYFRGKLGRKHVCVLYLDNFREAVEALSAFNGVVFIPFDTAGAWRTRLAKTIQDILRPSP
jgi:ATP-dependent Clp protease ATP-binding subunit ClpA